MIRVGSEIDTLGKILFPFCYKKVPDVLRFVPKLLRWSSYSVTVLVPILLHFVFAIY